MKKFIITLAVLATAMLTSCVQEKSFNGVPVGENEIAFVLQSGPSTRAFDMESPVKDGINVPIGQINNLSFYLKETITDLSFVDAETRGTPVYTENVGSLYKNKLFVHAEGFGDAVYETMDNAQVNGGWRYNHNYGSNKWPESGSVDFFLRMPDDMTLGTVTYGTGAKTTFTYTSPETAADQDDIIFSGITLDKATHDRNLPNGTKVTFYHALTGVKFAIGNTAAELSSKGIAITEITFTGLQNTGTCVIDPASETKKVDWTSTEAVEGNVISQTFSADENVVDFTEGDGNNFHSSFYASGNTQNVNKDDASYTFWLLPQDFSNSKAVLRISYTINNKDEYLDITLKDILADYPWTPGQLRTYTVKLDEVNVKITDKVETAGNADNGYSGSKKENVVITNTGNTPAFIRAAIVGQWLDPQGNPVFGFTDEVNDLYIVESWYEDQFVNGNHKHGEFTGLPGYGTTPSFKPDSQGSTAGWQLCKDGYYYYTEIVEAGDPTGSPLFTDYTTKVAPKASLAGEVLETAQMYFVLEISTQAITAVKMDGREGSRYTWKQAWKNATGTEPVEK